MWPCFTTPQRPRRGKPLKNHSGENKKMHSWSHWRDHGTCQGQMVVLLRWRTFQPPWQGDELVYGVAEVPTPTYCDETSLVVEVEVAPINSSDIGSACVLATVWWRRPYRRRGCVHRRSYFSRAPVSTCKDDGDKQPLGSEGMGVIVAAGYVFEAQSLLKKCVAAPVGASSARYTKTSLNHPVFPVLPDDVQVCSWTPRGA